MDPKGAVEVPVPVPVGETYISFAVPETVKAASAAARLSERMVEVFDKVELVEMERNTGTVQ